MNWGNEAYGMGMPSINHMMPPLVPLVDILMDSAPVPPMPLPPAAPMPLIGRIMPDNTNTETSTAPNSQMDSDDQTNDVTSSQNQTRRSRDRSGYSRRDYRDKDSKDQGRYRSRSQDRYDRSSDSLRYNDRQDRNINDKSRNNDRKSKWDSNTKMMTAMEQQNSALQMGNMNATGMNMAMMPGIIPYQNNMMSSNVMMNNMGTQSMDNQHLMMSNMSMMGNIMPNMMDQNGVMMNQPMMQPLIHPNQPIYLSSGILLPPTPGSVPPQRRDKPKGCRTIFVGGLPSNVNSESINEMFHRFGNIQEVKSPRNGVYYVRFKRPESVEAAFLLSNYKFKYHNQLDSEAMTLFVDYALNRDDQNEYEKGQRNREETPPRIEPFTPAALTSVLEKIKSETDFAEAAPTLVGWLERGECNKKCANQFYSLIQASNNQVRRLFNEKMQLDEELQSVKTSIKDKFARVVAQFEHVAKILSAAKHQRVSDHFSKQQRRNIEMWLKMTEEVENIKEEYNLLFDEEEVEKPTKNSVPLEKYEELKKENENLTYELEGYKNEAYLAKDEAERKFETFKAHFIAQQALQNKTVFPPLPTPKVEPPLPVATAKPMPPPPTPDDDKVLVSGSSVPPTEAKLISILTSFLLVHPLGASLDYLLSYVRSMTPNVTQATVLATLQKYTEIFKSKTTGIGACIEHRWYFVTFDTIKNET